MRPTIRCSLPVLLAGLALALLAGCTSWDTPAPPGMMWKTTPFDADNDMVELVPDPNAARPPACAPAARPALAPAPRPTGAAGLPSYAQPPTPPPPPPPDQR